ncbi:alpha/beta hydrolase [Bacillus sp. CRN 9]|nr:alpha/beta hydrolase [Bacillus sp. CRN 9]
MRYIFINGLGQNSTSWEKTISYIEGIGDISNPDLFELLQEQDTTYNNLYSAFCEHLEEYSEPVVLVGLSLGAILALNYTIEHPQRVQSIVLIGAQYKMPKLLLKVQNIIFRFMPESPFRKIGSSKNDFILLTKSMMELDFSNDLKKVRCNTLVLCGEKDKANKRAAKKLAEQIPKSKIGIVMDAGHEINMEAPEKLASILNEFFSLSRTV